MSNLIPLVIYKVAGIRYGIPIHLVRRVIRIVEITPIPQASEKIMGIINYYGEVIPIINMRKILNLHNKEIELSDQILIVRAENRNVGLWIDEVINIEEIALEDIVKPERMLKKDEYSEESLRGCIRLDNGLIVIHSIDTFISETDEKIIQDFEDRYINE